MSYRSQAVGAFYFNRSHCQFRDQRSEFSQFHQQQGGDKKSKRGYYILKSLRAALHSLLLISIKCGAPE
jgi:hypothetical protein